MRFKWVTLAGLALVASGWMVAARSSSAGAQ